MYILFHYRYKMTFIILFIIISFLYYQEVENVASRIRSSLSCWLVEPSNQIDVDPAEMNHEANEENPRAEQFNNNPRQQQRRLQRNHKWSFKRKRTIINAMNRKEKFAKTTLSVVGPSHQRNF